MSSMNKGRSFSSFNRFRKWEKVVEPIVKYNRNSSPLGYPLDFFYELEQIISAGHTLQLNIATTLTGAKDNCIRTIFQQNEQVGHVTFTGSIIKSVFDAEVERQTQERILKFCQRDTQFQAFYSSLKQNNACDQILPCALIKQKSVDEKIGEDGIPVATLDYRVLTLSRDQYKKMTNLQANQIAQCFVLGCGKQASAIRFFYFPGKQNSEAFKIDNLEGFMKRRFGKGQFKVRQQNQNSLTFVKIMFTNKSFYQQTLSLVQFLQKHQKISVTKIVCDWVMDPTNRYYLIDVKEVLFQRKIDPIRPQRTLTDALAYLTCAVCQQKYCAQQITKNLTDKLIYQFFQHLKKRQITLSFTPAYKNSSDTSRLCDLCYMLVVSESQLMQLQKSVAIATHSITGQQSSGARRWGKVSECGKMYEWRLFLFLQDIRDLVIQNYDEKHTYYVMMRLQNSITSFKLKDPQSRYNLVKGIKIHYIFSQKDKIEKFLVNTQISIRITKGLNWNSVVAEGSTSGLYEESQKHSMRKFKQILVFNQKSKYSVVGMHIGIKLQGRYDPSHLALTKYHDVFMVSDNYSNCYSLPAQWMQTIDPSYCITKAQTSTFNYGLHLAASQKKILFPNVNFNGSKQKKLIL